MNPLFLVVDLFCGAGGTTTGFDMTEGMAKVIACVNHDPKAIESHWKNHPEVLHFEEDIRTLDLAELTKCAQMYRRWYPEAKLVLWASLECTNFSKAKGGQPRDADSRTLADHLHRYIEALQPDYVQIENVVEFMSWGPLDVNGKPVSKKNGSDYMRWCREIKAHGYYDEWNELNSADFGAYTSRNRLFGCFARPGLPIVWPEPTHARNPEKVPGLYSPLKKWMPVRDVLDFSDEGKTIFRDKPLSEKTLERIYAGLIKYVAGMNQKAFIAKYYSGRPEGKVTSIDSPAGTIATAGTQALIRVSYMIQYNGGSPEGRAFDLDRPARVITTNHSGNQYLVQTSFLSQYNGGEDWHRNKSIEGPCSTVTTNNRHALVQPTFLLKYNSMTERGVHIPPSVEEPAPVVAAQPRLGLVQPQFLSGYYGNGDNVSPVSAPCNTISTRDRFGIVSTTSLQSVDQPAGTVMPNDKHRLMQCEFIMNPSHGGHSTSADAPCPVIVARQDKAPLYLLQVEQAPQVAVAVYEGDSPCTIKIKEFMALYGIVDIKMRMLKVPELLRIQGFPEGYQLLGSQADQKKFIGNSVVPHVVKAWTIAQGERISSVQSCRQIA
jgi:DNA (cytosine-5)-methyltransferase 1